MKDIQSAAMLGFIFIVLMWALCPIVVVFIIQELINPALTLTPKSYFYSLLALVILK